MFLPIDTNNILEISRVVFTFDNISPECDRFRQICNYHWKAQALRKSLQYYIASYDH